MSFFAVVKTFAACLLIVLGCALVGSLVVLAAAAL